MNPSKSQELPTRKRLPHQTPHWIDSTSSVFFITICCQTRGINQLCTRETGNALLESVVFRHEHEHWFIRLFLLMPDHLHFLASFPADARPMQSIISGWKAWTAKSCGIRWQRDYFEHRLRAEESFAAKADYIRENPVRAGLVKDRAGWPWVVSSDPRDGKISRR
jgi:putative transposase